MNDVILDALAADLEPDSVERTLRRKVWPRCGEVAPTGDLRGQRLRYPPVPDRLALTTRSFFDTPFL